MKPVFAHDHTDGEFLGHYFGHDVYAHDSGEVIFSLGSIVARYGNEGHEYASMPMFVLKQCLDANNRIGGTDQDGNAWSMPYREWIFSDRSIPSTSAMILALAMRGMSK